jgi:hypothetical protein
MRRKEDEKKSQISSLIKKQALVIEVHVTEVPYKYVRVFAQRRLEEYLRFCPASEGRLLGSATS